MRKKVFVLMALKYLGYPSIRYKGVHVGNTVSGFDCSGYTNFLLNKAKYPGQIPRHCNEFFDLFGILIHDQFRKAGDLVFFSSRSKGIRPDHMGVLVSRDKFIHSPGKDGKVVCVDEIEKEIIRSDNSIMQIYSDNPIGFKRITIKDGRYQQVFLT
jgi:cell wall-associated NlpC family hydrolase